MAGGKNIFTTSAIWDGLSGCVELVEVDWYSQLRICRRSKAAALGNEERRVCVTYQVCVFNTATEQSLNSGPRIRYPVGSKF